MDERDGDLGGRGGGEQVTEDLEGCQRKRRDDDIARGLANRVFERGHGGAQLGKRRG